MVTGPIDGSTQTNSKQFERQWRYAWLLAVAVASLAAIVALGKMLSLNVYIPPPSDAAQYKSAVAKVAFPWIVAALAFVALAVSFPYIARWRPANQSVAPSARATADAVWWTSIAFSMLAVVVSAFSFLRMNAMMAPFKPEIAAIETFPTPSSWQLQATVGYALFHPAAERRWQVPASLTQVCSAARTSLEGWAEEGSVGPKNEPSDSHCSFRAARGQHMLEMDAFVGVREGEVTTTLRLSRKERIRPQSVH